MIDKTLCGICALRGEQVLSQMTETLVWNVGCSALDRGIWASEWGEGLGPNPRHHS